MSQSQVRLLSLTNEVIDPNTIGTTPTECRLVLAFDVWYPTDDINADIAALAARVRFDGPPETSDNEPMAAEDEDDGNGGNVTTSPTAQGSDASSDSGDDSDAADSETDEVQEFESAAPFVAMTPAQLQTAIDSQNYQTWDREHRLKLRELLHDELKPGLIIDGQHRVSDARGG